MVLNKTFQSTSLYVSALTTAWKVCVYIDIQNALGVSYELFIVFVAKAEILVWMSFKYGVHVQAVNFSSQRVHELSVFSW